VTGNYRHIRFEEIEGFTVCRSNHGGAVLGRVEWMARWKEYEFIPEADTAYTVECLRDLAEFVGKMNAARKALASVGVGAYFSSLTSAKGLEATK